MRVVSGVYRSLRIQSVPGEQTRPTTDKNKEMMFNLLGQYFDGGKVLDLFAGSGALGIEALSRGMDHCIFVDLHPLAIRTIQANCQSLALASHQYEIVKSDALLFLRQTQHVYDLVLIDPPYHDSYYPKLIQLLEEKQLVSRGGLLLIESLKAEVLPKTIGPLKQIKERMTGITKLTIYQSEVDL